MKNSKFKDILVFRNKDSFNFSQIKVLIVSFDDCKLYEDESTVGVAASAL